MSEPNEFLPGTDEPTTVEAEPAPEAQTALAVVQKPVSALAARDAGIAAFLASAYAKAGILQLTPEETKALKADFPDEAIVTGAAGKEHLIYIEAPALRNRMDEVLGMGGWSHVSLRTWNEEYKTTKNTPAVRVYHECVLIVRGVYITQAIGDMSYYPGNPDMNYGDAWQGSQSASLRRCLRDFGVGLQAWSKVFAAGWFERKRASQRGGNAPGRAAAAPPLQTQPAKPQAAPSAPKIATATTRAYVLDQLGCQVEGVPRNTLHSFLVALGWLDNEKGVEQWPIWSVPVSKEEIEAVKRRMTDFSVKGVAVAPYAPHGGPPAAATLQGQPAATVTPPAATPPPATPEPELAMPEPAPAAPGWRDYVMTFGSRTKGKTLGSLPEAEVKNYIENFTVRESVEDDKGMKHVYAPAIVEAQKALRAALDEAAAEFASKK